MPIFSIDLNVDQYADYTQLLVWTAGGAAVDFTGATATMMARVTPSDVTPLVSLSTTISSQGAIFLGAPDGSTRDALNAPVPAGGIELWIAKAQLGAMLTAPLSRFDVLVTWANSEVQDVWSGYLRLRFGNNH